MNLPKNAKSNPARAPKPPDYDAIEQRLWRENADAVPALLAVGDANLQTKIKTYTRQFGYTVDAVREKIAADPMFAAHFAKKPNRQGIHETIAADRLRTLPMVRDFEVLPKMGANALYVTSDGEVKRGRQPESSKSLDFRWHTGDTTCYAMHKHTRESGGSQSSQFREMRDLLRQFQNCPDETCVLLVIVDGPYYTPARMARLRHYTRDRPPRSYALHIQDVPNALAAYAR